MDIFSIEFWLWRVVSLTYIRSFLSISLSFDTRGESLLHKTKSNHSRYSISSNIKKRLPPKKSVFLWHSLTRSRNGSKNCILYCIPLLLRKKYQFASLNIGGSQSSDTGYYIHLLCHKTKQIQKSFNFKMIRMTEKTVIVYFLFIINRNITSLSELPTHHVKLHFSNLIYVLLL